MSRLRKLEKRILEIGERIYQIYDEEFLRVYDPDGQDEDIEKQWLREELKKLEAERKILLDRRESWLPKTIWMVLVPIVVSLIVTIATPHLLNYLGIKTG